MKICADVHSLAIKIRDYSDFPPRAISPESKRLWLVWFITQTETGERDRGGSGRLCLHRSATNTFPCGSKLDITLLRYIACITRRPWATEAFSFPNKASAWCEKRTLITSHTGHSKVVVGKEVILLDIMQPFNPLSKVVHAPVVKPDWVIKGMVPVKWKQLQHR